VHHWPLPHWSFALAGTLSKVQIAVSSWSLNNLLQPGVWDSPEGVKPAGEPKPDGIDLLEFPNALAEHGYQRLELCHFHLPTRDASYLEELRQALKQSGVTLQTLLIDEGDITNPETGERDANWIKSWVETAEILGAEGARVIAGKQQWSEEAFERSAKALERFAKSPIRIRIENWFDLLKTPAHLFQLLDTLEGNVGLCMDFGNWGGATKYEDLAQIAPRAETCHAKAEFLPDGRIEEQDYLKCAQLSRNAGYTGPYVLVAGGSWDALKRQADFLQAHG